MLARARLCLCYEGVTGFLAWRAPTRCGRTPGEIPVSVFRFLSATPTGELPPGRLTVRPCGSIGAVRRLAAWGFPARGPAVTPPPLRPRQPPARSRYGG